MFQKEKYCKTQIKQEGSLDIQNQSVNQSKDQQNQQEKQNKEIYQIQQKLNSEISSENQQKKQLKPNSKGYQRQLPPHLRQQPDQPQENNDQNKKISNKNFEKQQEQKQDKNTQSTLETKLDKNPQKKREKYQRTTEEQRQKYQEFNKGELGELIQTLYDKIKSNSIDCLICCSLINARDHIWSCAQCSKPFHLSCTKTWILKNNKEQDKQKNSNYMWTCPQCCYYFSEKMPKYFCFCGSVLEPEEDSYSLPHSCGQLCKRKQPCRHPCPLPCHPGPCPSCKTIENNVICFCEKTVESKLCSQTQYSCNQICGKKLNCKKHLCEKICHDGQCDPCQKTEMSSCHCGKERDSLICPLNQFQCNSICAKQLDCTHHNCQYQCHQGKCPSCPYDPIRMKTCPCGKTNQVNREKCTDEIQTCRNLCSKKLACGKHYCSQICHLGDCSPCKETVLVKCVCQQTNQKVECFRQKEQIRCYKICGKFKSCKVHRCQNECCSMKNGGSDTDGVHLCLKVCGKKLNCQLHNCALFCHIGVCSDCPIMVGDLSCVCGKTVKNGPNPCGTQRPECKQNCSRERPCGHQCPSNCHIDQCQPCRYPVSKICNCGRELVQNIDCCQQQANCGKVCREKLKCGHFCDQICHEHENYDQQCKQQCLRIKECGHKCAKLCHPGEQCPQEDCETNVKILCECGNRFSLIPCKQIFEDRSVSHKESQLECNDYCRNLKRFGQIFDSQKSYYPAQLVRFARKHYSFVQKLEKQIEQMVKEGKGYLDIPLNPEQFIMKKNIELLLQQNYRADFDAYYNIQPPFISLKNSETLKIPQVKLTYYLKQVSTGQIHPDVLPFDCTIRFMHLNKFDQIDDLNVILKDYQELYYAERPNEKTLLIHFWNQEHAESAGKKFKKQLGNFNQFVIEENFKLQLEDKQIQNMNTIKNINTQEIKKQQMQEKLIQYQQNMPKAPVKESAPEQNVYSLLMEETTSKKKQKKKEQIDDQVENSLSDDENHEMDSNSDSSEINQENTEQDDDGFINVLRK